MLTLAHDCSCPATELTIELNEASCKSSLSAIEFPSPCAAAMAAIATASNVGPPEPLAPGRRGVSLRAEERVPFASAAVNADSVVRDGLRGYRFLSVPSGVDAEPSVTPDEREFGRRGPVGDALYESVSCDTGNIFLRCFDALAPAPRAGCDRPDPFESSETVCGG
eukprot:5978098-Pleurochrysis_carterae.AAC.2